MAKRWIAVVYPGERTHDQLDPEPRLEMEEWTYPTGGYVANADHLADLAALRDQAKDTVAAVRAQKDEEIAELKARVREYLQHGSLDGRMVRQELRRKLATLVALDDKTTENA